MARRPQAARAKNSAPTASRAAAAAVAAVVAAAGRGARSAISPARRRHAARLSKRADGEQPLPGLGDQPELPELPEQWAQRVAPLTGDSSEPAAASEGTNGEQQAAEPQARRRQRRPRRRDDDARAGAEPASAIEVPRAIDQARPRSLRRTAQHRRPRAFVRADHRSRRRAGRRRGRPAQTRLVAPADRVAPHSSPESEVPYPLRGQRWEGICGHAASQPFMSMSENRERWGRSRWHHRRHGTARSHRARCPCLLPGAADAATRASTGACSSASPRPASIAGRSARRAPPSSRTAASSRRAAAAQEAGFRPCLRCRPETAPDLGVLARHLEHGVARPRADRRRRARRRRGASVDALAERLGVGERQLRRLFQQHLGASPIAVAQTRRVLFAKQLIHDTRLPMAEIALAAGFGSIRRFNETFQQLFRRPPSALRRKAVARSARGLGRRDRRDGAAALSAALRLARHAGVPARARDRRRRVGRGRHLSPHRAAGRPHSAPSRSATCRRRPASARPSASPRVRALPAHRRAHPARLRPRRRCRDDRRASRAGSVAGAADRRSGPACARPAAGTASSWRCAPSSASRSRSRRRASSPARLVQLCGAAAAGGAAQPAALRLAFPTAAQVAAADLSALGMPNARKAALVALAEAALADPALFQPARHGRGDGGAAARDPRHRRMDGALHRLARGARDRCFPGQRHRPAARRRRSASASRPSPAVLQDRAETWRPWRAYAAQHLWAGGSQAAHG